MKTGPVHSQSVTGRPRRRGITLTEFAVVAPLFFVLLLAGIEFAALNIIRSTAHNAAYEAARKLVIPGADSARGIQEAKRIMGIVGVQSLTVAVTPTVIDETTKEVTVRVDVPYARNAVFIPWFTGNVTITSEVILRTERYGGVSGS